MCSPCSAPAAELVTHIEPRAGPAKRSSRWAKSAIGRPGSDGADLGRHRGELEPGDEARQMVRVGPDVAQHQRGGALRGVEAPVRGGIPVGLGRPREVALDVLDVDLADRAERAVPHHRAGVADHRVAGVVVGQAEHAAARPHPPHQIERVVEAWW